MSNPTHHPPPHTPKVHDRRRRPDPSGPNSVFAPPPGDTTPTFHDHPGTSPPKGTTPRTARTHHERHHPGTGRQNLDVPPRSNPGHHTRVHHGAQAPPPTGRRRSNFKLLRKEVIQPHLPVRLPCYDLVPITSPTFDSSLHKGWATGFGCYRLS